VGREGRVTLRPGTRAAGLYGASETVERYYCNYGVNAEWAGPLERGGLTPSGVGEDGELRIVELRDHPFYVATLFLPQARSSPASPHPVLTGFAAAVRGGP
jgi:CTP synthase (UTP-ammonia lyase)